MKIFILMAIVFVLFLFIFNIKRKGYLLLAKGSLQIGILILFIGGFFKLFVSLPPNPYLKLIFCLTYIWCTVGINVNFMIPLINLIGQNLEKYK